MPTGHRSARRRRRQGGRVARIAVPVAIPLALAVVVGVIVAAVNNSGTNVNSAANANCISQAAYQVPAAQGPSTQTPTATTAGATAPATAAASTQAPATVATGSTASAAAGTGTTAPTTAATGNTASATAAASTQAPATAATSTTASATATATSTQTPTAAATTSSASAAPCPSTSATAPAVNPEAGHPDLAMTNPVDPTGAAISLTQTAAEAATSLNCTLIVPSNPLSAKGLARPWQLGDGCAMSNPNEEAFVEATILAPNGKLQVYDPLVVTQGTTPAVAPKAPKISGGSQVIINVGFNGNNLVLEGHAAQGNCIDAFGNSIIAQTSACNAAAFFGDANAQIAGGRLRVPALGTATDGKVCETTESFSVIDQDQSDNVISAYLMNGNGQTAQNTTANQNAMGGNGTVITNGSDDALLGHFIDKALGCTPFMAPDSTSANGSDGSLALNALSARHDQQTTKALLPVNDPQLLVAGQFSIGKTNAYRVETDQPLLSRNTNKNQNAAAYCQSLVNIAPAKLQLDSPMEVGITSPVPATGNNLATFLGARLSASFTNMNCGNFGLTNPVTVTTDGNGVATAVTYTTTQQTANANAAGGNANGTGSTATATGTASATGTATASASATASATHSTGGNGNGGYGHGWGYDRDVPRHRHGHRENGSGM